MHMNRFESFRDYIFNKTRSVVVIFAHVSSRFNSIEDPIYRKYDRVTCIREGVH